MIYIRLILIEFYNNFFLYTMEKRNLNGFLYSRIYSKLILTLWSTIESPAETCSGSILDVKSNRNSFRI